MSASNFFLSTGFHSSPRYELKDSVFNDPDDNISEFSRNSNALVIILDAKQNANTFEFIESRPEIKRALERFVLFHDVVAGFPITEIDLLNILSAKPYGLSKLLRSYMAEVYVEYSILLVASFLGMNVITSMVDECSR